MSDHRQFEEMVARRHELNPPEASTLSEHLETCQRCRDAADSYALQDIALRPLSWDRCSQVGGHVLAEIDKMPQKPALPRIPIPSMSWLRGLGLRAALVAVVTSAIIVNVPGRETVRAAPTGPWAWTSCNAEGYALLSYTRILTSPAQFRGPNVIFIKAALLEAEDTISAPTYYVFPRSPSTGTCRPNTEVTDIVVAVNTQTGAELHVVGISKTAAK